MKLTTTLMWLTILLLYSHQNQAGAGEWRVEVTDYDINNNTSTNGTTAGGYAVAQAYVNGVSIVAVAYAVSTTPLSMAHADSQPAGKTVFNYVWIHDCSEHPEWDPPTSLTVNHETVATTSPDVGANPASTDNYAHAEDDVSAYISGPGSVGRAYAWCKRTQEGSNHIEDCGPLLDNYSQSFTFSTSPTTITLLSGCDAVATTEEDAYGRVDSMATGN